MSREDTRDLKLILEARQLSRQAALNAIADVQRRREERWARIKKQAKRFRA